MPVLHGWKSLPKRLAVGFTMTKPEGLHAHVAVCEVWTTPGGWELRLIMDGHGMPITTVVRSIDEMRALVGAWRVALLEAGWS